MYCLVLGILVATVLLVLGGSLTLILGEALYMHFRGDDASVLLWPIAVFAPAAAVFLWASVITMAGTIAALRRRGR